MDKLRDVCGPQARNRFNQVVEAKMLEGLFYVEKCVEFKNQTLQKFGWYTTVLCATEYPWGMQYAEFKNQTLKKSTGTQKCYAQRNTPGYAISQNSAKMGVPLQVYALNHVISVVKCKFWQQTIYNDQCSI